MTHCKKTDNLPVPPPFKVQILMSTYNGDKYLDAQIQSLASQEGVEISILVRDDGSTDRTHSILDRWEKGGILKWYSGHNIKPARSFMDLMFNAPPSDYYAFCDQDDVWDSDKLKVAITMLSESVKDEPGLYFSNTRLVDANLLPIGTMELNPRITLGSALIINPVVGCTAVFNKELLAFIKQYNHQNLYMHDGWLYRVCLAIGGKAIFDKQPHISYRQHSSNVVGVRGGVYKRFKRRVASVLINRRCIRQVDARALLDGYSGVMSEENRIYVAMVANYKNSLIDRLKLIANPVIKTNNFEHNFSFVLAVLTGAF